VLVPIEWLREYIDFDIDVKDLANRLTMAGLEVEEIRETPQGTVFSTYVTPNRSDLLSMIGVARETGALLDADLKVTPPTVIEGNQKAADLVTVEIESPENCVRYAARVLLGVKICPSPNWMQDRLLAAGMRPINNVVDATNYVLIESGQPLHAFDYDRVTDHRIRVRQAAEGEKIVTLDGEERTLAARNLVIADAKRPIAVAGVMGGFDSEVSFSTKNILLESAIFNGRSIRRTARDLGLSTEASFRFERGVDPNLVPGALDRVVQLIGETSHGELAVGIVDVYPNRVHSKVVDIRPKRATELLGFEITSEQAADYLTRLGLDVDSSRPETLKCTVPTFRLDIQREEDLIEEVGRIYGYERIPESLPTGETMHGKDSEEGRLASKISEVLVSAGMQEVVTGSMTSPVEGEAQVEIRNPLSDEVSCLRSNIVLDLLAVLSYNASRGIRDIALFEVGHVFHPQDQSGITERLSVGAVLAGSMWEPTWNIDRTSLEVDFFLTKGIVENLLDRLGVREVVYKATEIDRLHPTRAAVILAGGEQIGFIGQISSETARRYEVPERTYSFELDFDRLAELSGESEEYVPLTRYPAVMRDLAVVVAESIPYRRVDELISGAGGDLLAGLSLFDVYAGAPLPPGQKNLAFTITFRSRERTLRDEEVDERLNQIKTVLSAELGASFRET
jgi:phenylalanyl-tRNA synthetase beta chain